MVAGLLEEVTAVLDVGLGPEIGDEFVATHPLWPRGE